MSDEPKSISSRRFCVNYTSRLGVLCGIRAKKLKTVSRLNLLWLPCQWATNFSIKSLGAGFPIVGGGRLGYRWRCNHVNHIGKGTLIPSMCVETSFLCLPMLCLQSIKPCVLLKTKQKEEAEEKLCNVTDILGETEREREKIESFQKSSEKSSLRTEFCWCKRRCYARQVFMLSGKKRLHKNLSSSCAPSLPPVSVWGVSLLSAEPTTNSPVCNF